MAATHCEDVSFTYEALTKHELREIRLVSLLCAELDAPIQCQLFHTFLDEDAPAFEALSYTWGEAPATGRIFLDDLAFVVTENLHSALRHLRRQVSARFLWIDAICLNQADDREKEHQIPYMHTIYQQAEAVLVWLGPASADSDLAMDYIQARHALVEPGREIEVSDIVHHDRWPLTLYPRAPLSQEDIKSAFAFFRLISRPWWRRAWIVQEISFAKELHVQCGNRLVSWTQMHVALLMTRQNHVLLVAHTDIVDRGKSEDGQGHEWTAQVTNNALSLLYDRQRILDRESRTRLDRDHAVTETSWSLAVNRARHCARPHDRIYSILGIAGKELQGILVPDYAQPAEMLYRNVVRDYVRATGSLNAILYSQHSVWRPSQPSWAPDWSQPERAAIFHQNGQKLSQPVPLDMNNTMFSEDMAQLRVPGLFVGKITSVAIEFDELLKPEQPFYGNFRTKLSSNSGLVESRGRTWWEFKEAVDGGKMFEPALEHIPVGDPLWHKHLELFLGMLSLSRKPSSTNVFAERFEESSPAIPEYLRFQGVEEFWDLLIYLLATRTVCATAEGGLVVAPDFTEVGDEVYMLAGCSNPVVLRNTTGGAFRLMGDCHVLGLDGQEDCIPEQTSLVLV